MSIFKGANKYLIPAGGVAALALVGWVSKATVLAKNLIIETKSNVKAAGVLGKIEVKTDVTFKNPTPGSITIKRPTVQVKLAGVDAPIMTSNVVNEDITIAPQSQVSSEAGDFSTIVMKTGLLSIATMAPDIFEAIKQGKGQELQVWVNTTVITSVKKLTINRKVESFVLNLKQFT